eukprot:m.1526416 g.1526416  ORF g.1526416 m.1526416 type:complete len:166 (+) comp25234_c0_seq32:3259-3756(+)
MTRRRLHRLVQFSFACDQIPFMLTALFDQNLLLPIPSSAFTLQLRHLNHCTHVSNALQQRYRPRVHHKPQHTCSRVFAQSAAPCKRANKIAGSCKHKPVFPTLRCRTVRHLTVAALRWQHCWRPRAAHASVAALASWPVVARRVIPRAHLMEIMRKSVACQTQMH